MKQKTQKTKTKRNIINKNITKHKKKNTQKNKSFINIKLLRSHTH